jgi:hypothetical protein
MTEPRKFRYLCVTEGCDEDFLTPQEAGKHSLQFKHEVFQT